MTHSQGNPSKRDLRIFGWTMGGMIMLFFGLLIPWIWNLGLLTWPWIVGGAFAIWALVPIGMTPVYHLWMKVGLVLGWVNSRIILGAVFYLVVTPMGAVMRLLGKDPMKRRLDADAQSYRVDSVNASPEQFEKPY